MHRFQFDSLGEIQIRGRGEPVPAWRLLRPQGAATVVPRTPFVNRHVEMARLRSAVEELKAGRGQVLLLVGEAGIGKTRLLAELRSIAGADVTWLEGQCHSYGGLASWPFIEILRTWLGAEDGDAEVVVRTKARAKLGAVFGADLVDVLPALGRLLRIELDPELEERVRLPEESLAVEIRRAYAAWIEALTASGPAVLAVEDLQWADQSSRELAEALLELTDRAPLLLATTMTVDPSSEGWWLRMRVLSDYVHRATELSLSPLTAEAAEELVRQLLPAGLDDSTRRQVVERAEGNPLYLEELLRSLVERGGVERRRRTWTLTVRATDLLPPALENVLVARIDRLPDGARRLAQAAAVIGRDFPVRVLDRVAASDDTQENLAVLLRAEVVREVRRYPELECTFKHGLYQEAALSTLTAARRRELYGRAAAAFEELFANSLDNHLEQLAHYHAQAENLPRALAYLERAGTRAAALDASSRALGLLERAARVAGTVGDEAGERRIRERLAELRS